MKEAIIKKGNHRPFPPTLGLTFKKELSYDYIFTESCRYNRGDEDQFDLNKLHGIGFFPSHHKNSIRSAWRYNVATGKIEIFAYCYRDKDRAFYNLNEVEIGKKVIISLSIGRNTYIVSSNDGTETTKCQLPHFMEKLPLVGYKLGIFIGGGDKSGKDDTAMHDMTILYKRL